MSGPKVATVLVRLYPRRWRDRYADELLELLSATPLSTVGVLALLRGAVDAHFNLPDLLPGLASRTLRLRWYMTLLFGAWVAFCFAAAGVAKSVEAPAFASAAARHPLLAVEWDASRWAFTVAASAIILGALPLAAGTVIQIFRDRDRKGFRLFATPVLSAGAVLGSGALLGRYASGHSLDFGTVAAAGAWLALVLVVAVLTVRSTGELLHRSGVPGRLFRWASCTGAAAAGAMTVGLAVGAAYGLSVMVLSPALFSSANGVLATALPVTWGAALVIALAAVGVADRAAVRALQNFTTPA